MISAIVQVCYGSVAKQFHHVHFGHFYHSNTAIKTETGSQQQASHTNLKPSTSTDGIERPLPATGIPTHQAQGCV